VLLIGLMQKLNWYYKRLRAMSPDEIAWRIRSSIRDRGDRFFVGRRQRQRKPLEFLNGSPDGKKEGFRVCNIPVRYKTDNEAEKQKYDSLIARAKKIAGHRFSFFDLQDKYLGDPIIWNRDHKLWKDTPMIFSPSLDYRDIKVAGDCKYVWEPNRHHQLVVLGRAFRLSDDIRFAEAVAEQLDSWLRQNPYGIGMNWRSGLELGIRLINWVWAFDLIQQSQVVGEELYQRLMGSVARHIWEIDRKYSRGSSVNNHLIGEAAGVFTAASYFKDLKNASVWRDRSREILVKEIINQISPDGGTKEQAVGYHIFVLQFFVIAGLVARATGRDFPESYWSQLEKMFEFINKLSEGGDNLPNFGDCDDGYVLDIGSNPHNVKQWLAVGAALFKRGDFVTSYEHTEPIEWLPGLSRRDYDPACENRKCSSIAFSQSGYYLLQQGDLNSTQRISVVFDCGPLGMGTLAGHGHADALSFTLRAFGSDILVDPGTYDYFSYPQWREYFRSTRAHNTVVVDGNDQSEMLGLFLWGRKAQAQCLSWEPTDTGGRVIGEHNGYSTLSDPVIHRRTLELDGCKRELTIRDDIIACKEHNISIFFHFAEQCVINPADQNHYSINVGPATIGFKLDSNLQVESFKGSTDPIFGWVSRGYHQKQPAATLVGRCSCKGNISLVCKVDMGCLK
jgi:hypothetical protein